MKKLGIAASLVATLAAVVALAASSAMSRGGSRLDFDAHLTGFNEVPAISTTGRGSLDVDLVGGVLRYRLRYSRLESNALFAHIHFAQRRVNGGVIAFLCGGGDKPACPARAGTVTGTIDAADIIGPEAQGIEPGAFDEVVRAMRAQRTYANVHTERFPQGEIRGQIFRD
ncbi:MAG: CHRD domain-containing protein [Actinomycetota bacterium]|nr:CHRD domain-containing protein [Actinomycetota bacterium]